MKTKDEFERWIAACNAKAAKREAAIRSFREQYGECTFKVAGNNGWTIIVSPIIGKPGWRSTRVDEHGPSGHSERKTWDECVEEAVQDYSLDLNKAVVATATQRHEH